MALVLKDRVQETATPNTTVSFTCTGAVTGFQAFSTIGNGNTTFYTGVDGSGNWECGLGTYTTAGNLVTRTTILASSNAGSAVTFSGAVSLFVNYPATKSVNLDASGNVSALGTVASGTWQGSTVGVVYGGTGVTTSTGANSVVLRDANENIIVNSVTQELAKTVSSATITTLTAASSHFQVLTGTAVQTYKLPDATLLPTGSTWVFDNDSTGNLTITDNAGATVDVVAAGGYSTVFLEANGTVGGEWGRFGMIPAEVNWGTNSLNLGGSTLITNGTWNGTTIAYNYGGTGLTSFTAANNALYSTSASALTAGTLPVLAGGTGVTTSTGSGSVVLSTSPTLVTPALGVPASGTVTNLTGTASININGTVGATTATTGKFTTLEYTGTLTGGTGVIAIGTNQIYKDASGNVGIGTTNPIAKLEVGTLVDTTPATFTGTLKVTGATQTTLAAVGGIELPIADAYGIKIQALAATGSALVFARRNNSATWVETMRIDASGNVTLQENISVGGAAPTTSGSGITFPATQSASTDANTLDDYEEGVWTPVLTSGFTTTGTVTRTGNYTKVGRVVTVNFIIQATSNVIANGAVLSGLPFPATQYGIGLSTSASGTATAMSITVSGSTLIFGGVSLSASNLIGSITYITT